MPTILITGASSGLGLAFLSAYATNPSNTLHTADIQPLPPTHSSLSTHHHILDITSLPSIQSLASFLHNTPLDLLIHSIGVRGLVDSLHTSVPGSAAAAETLQAMNADTMTSTFAINTLGSFELFRALLPSLLASQSPSGAKVIVMSSRMGSLTANVSGGGYAYRASKAALNAVVRSLSLDVKGVTWVLCHPGRVESGLVRYREEGAISAEESVRGLVGLIEKWGKEDSGRFYDRFGGVIEW